MAVDVKVWLDRNADLYRSIEAAALKQDPGTTQLRVWTRIALDKADELAAQAEPWAADARHAAVQALNMVPTDDGVPSDRYFRRLCRVQALYGVLTHLASPDGQPALNADEQPMSTLGAWPMPPSRVSVGWRAGTRPFPMPLPMPPPTVSTYAGASQDTTRRNSVLARPPCTTVAEQLRLTMV